MCCKTQNQNLMLLRDKVIGIYCLIDDMLKGIKHAEDIRRRVSDSEVMTTAVVSAMFFSGHHQHALGFMKATGMIPDVLSSSRFSRRVHKVGELLVEIFLRVGVYIQSITAELEYILDSFPVATCDNIRIIRSKLLKGKKWRGYTASMRRYFYGIKVQLLVSRTGIPIRFCFVPGRQSDAKAMAKMIDQLPPECAVYADSAYTNYKVEDSLRVHQAIFLKAQRKSNSKRPDKIEIALMKTKMRKRVETVISNIKKLFPKCIHAVTLNGFLIKLILFIFAAQLNKIIK